MFLFCTLNVGNFEWRQFKHFKTTAYKTQTEKSELDIYLEEKEIDDDDYEDFNVLEWWCLNEIKYKILSRMARDILSIQLASVLPKLTFITDCPIVNENISSYSPSIVEAYICTGDWIRKMDPLLNFEVVSVLSYF